MLIMHQYVSIQLGIFPELKGPVTLNIRFIDKTIAKDSKDTII